MKNYQHSFARKLQTIAAVILTLSMLLLAGIYISGSQRTSGGVAINNQLLPDGWVAVGDTPVIGKAVYEKGLMPVSFAAIDLGGKGGGAYGNEAVAKALLDFSLESVHSCLSGGAAIEAVTAEEFGAALETNYIFLDLLTSLPYQMIYALSGEYISVAGSENAVSADRLVLSFLEGTKAMLFLSDGESFYKSNTAADIRYFEIYALANDSRLGSAVISSIGIPHSSVSPMISSITVTAQSEIAADKREKILDMFGFDTETTADSTAAAVAPHGSMRITPSNAVYIASQDSGIEVSDFLEEAKEALDIGIYDILLASVEFCERLRDMMPEISGGELYLSGFYRDGDTYTITVNLASESVALGGEGYPHFARFTVQGGRFKSIRVSLLQIEKNSYSDTCFPSEWQYAHASKTHTLRTLRLVYNIGLVTPGEIQSAWYFTEGKR